MLKCKQRVGIKPTLELKCFDLARSSVRGSGVRSDGVALLSSAVKPVTHHCIRF